jgi:succinate dehydrogenase / fumarate reductase, cytochrome b subunit
MTGVAAPTVPQVRRGWIAGFYASTIGRKVVMALTGIVLVAFVTGHVLGNLLMFSGPAAMNGYADLLKSNMALLWGIRAGLGLAVILHVHAAWSLTRMSRAARPAGYTTTERRAATLSAVTIRVGGVLLLVFLVFHLLHFTTGTLHPAFSPTDVYGNVIVGFSIPAVTAFYVLAMVALGLHLHHGVWSLFQTLGWNHPHLNAGRRRLALGWAVVVAVLFASIPLAVGFGVVR